MNLERGLKKSMVLAAIGFTVPVIVLGVRTAFLLVFVDTTGLDTQQTLAALPWILVTAFFWAIVLALAGFVSYAPNRGVNISQTLAVLVAIIVIWFLVTRPFPRKTPPDTSWWLGIAVLFGAIVLTTAIILVMGISGRSHESANAHQRSNSSGA